MPTGSFQRKCFSSPDKREICGKVEGEREGDERDRERLRRWRERYNKRESVCVYVKVKVGEIVRETVI